MMNEPGFMVLISATGMVLISGLFVFLSHEFGIDRIEAIQQLLRIFIPLFVIYFTVLLLF